MTNLTLNFYQKNNKKLTAQYNSINFESVHQDWLSFLPEKGALIADIGAGSGRDAIWLSNQGYEVISVEPIIEFYDQFKLNQKDKNIEWVIDSLPMLKKLEKYKNQISLMLLSAVWMHLTTEERITSFDTFSKLNKQNGLLIISLRHGNSPDERQMYPVSIEEIEILANKFDYQIKTVKQSDDQLSRKEVFWETVVLEKISLIL